jgi:hypothetical protein
MGWVGGQRAEHGGREDETAAKRCNRKAHEVSWLKERAFHDACMTQR